MPRLSSAQDHKTLVHNLKLRGAIKSHVVERAMLRVDRKFYCPEGPYFDLPNSIGYGVTISAPHMHAYALELLKDHVKVGCFMLLALIKQHWTVFFYE
jgi:protein-L-isoaspartate(D-aspartate) O-methyltransferase